MRKYLAFSIAFILLSAASANAQWDWNLVKDSATMEPYFINVNYGFLHPIEYWHVGLVEFGETVFQDDHHILRTTDGRKTWREPRDYGGMLGRVRGMFFLTPSRGYVAVAQSNTSVSAESGGVFETLDSGETWRRISPFGIGYDAVYAIGDTILATATSISDRQDIPKNELTAASGIMRSTDRGATWSTSDRAVHWYRAYCVRSCDC
jgi:hypothetical protein